MDLERQTRQLRLDGYVTLVDIQKFLEEQSGKTQSDQYVRFQPGGKKGKEPILSVGVHKANSDKLTEFLKDVNSRVASWGMAQEKLPAAEAAALQKLATLCKKPKLATVNSVKTSLEPLSQFQRCSFPLANRYARTWEKHKAEIWPGLGLENVTSAQRVAGKTKLVNTQDKAGQLYRIITKVLSKLPDQFELVIDRNQIENAITTAVTVLPKEEKALLADASCYLSDLKNEKIGVVVKEILPLMRMKASDTWEKKPNEADPKVVREACLTNLQNRAVKLCQDRGIAPDAAGRVKSTSVPPISPRLPSLDLAAVKSTQASQQLNRRKVSSEESASSSSSSSIVGSGVSTAASTPHTTPANTPRGRELVSASKRSPLSLELLSSQVQPSPRRLRRSMSPVRLSNSPSSPTVSPSPNTYLAPPSGRDGVMTHNRDGGAHKKVTSPPPSPRRCLVQSHNAQPSDALPVRGRSKSQPIVYKPESTPGRDAGLDADIDLDELSRLLDQFDPGHGVGANTMVGRESVQQCWNSQRQEVQALLEAHYVQKKSQVGQGSVATFIARIDDMLKCLPIEFAASELVEKIGVATRDSRVWLDRDKKIVQNNTAILKRLSETKECSAGLLNAMGIAAACSLNLPKRKT